MRGVGAGGDVGGARGVDALGVAADRLVVDGEVDRARSRQVQGGRHGGGRIDRRGARGRREGDDGGRDVGHRAFRGRQRGLDARRVDRGHLVVIRRAGAQTADTAQRRRGGAHRRRILGAARGAEVHVVTRDRGRIPGRVGARVARRRPLKVQTGRGGSRGDARGGIGWSVDIGPGRRSEAHEQHG